MDKGGNFKVKCVKDYYDLGELAWKRDSIYEYTNGWCVREDGFMSSEYANFKHLITVNNEYKDCLIELVEPVPTNLCGNFKVKCIKDHYACGEMFWKQGNIYEYIDGRCMREDGLVSGTYTDFEHLITVNKDYKDCLIELVEAVPANSYGNFKVKCVKDYYICGRLGWAKDKIYEFKSGSTEMENGWVPIGYKSFNDLIKYNVGFKNCLTPYEEEVKTIPTIKPKKPKTTNSVKIGNKIIINQLAVDRNYHRDRIEEMKDLAGTIANVVEVLPGNQGIVAAVSVINDEVYLFEADEYEIVRPEIEYLNDIKIVFNPPYTIVTGQHKQIKKGVAKCHPEDKYDKWEGYKIAFKRYLYDAYN